LKFLHGGTKGFNGFLLKSERDTVKGGAAASGAPLAIQN
jgi:hypothetical protein